MGAAGEDDNLMAALGEVARENAADLAAASGNDDAQWPFDQVHLLKFSSVLDRYYRC